MLPTPQFEAKIRVLTERPLHYGARLGFKYAEANGPTLFIIWPVSFGEDGRLLEFKDGCYPFDEWVTVGMVILSDEYRHSVHRSRLAIGTEFFLQDGSRPMVEGVVTKLLPALYED